MIVVDIITVVLTMIAVCVAVLCTEKNPILTIMVVPSCVVGIIITWVTYFLVSH